MCIIHGAVADWSVVCQSSCNDAISRERDTKLRETKPCAKKTVETIFKDTAVKRYCEKFASKYRFHDDIRHNVNKRSEFVIPAINFWTTTTGSEDDDNLFLGQQRKQREEENDRQKIFNSVVCRSYDLFLYLKRKLLKKKSFSVENLICKLHSLHSQVVLATVEAWIETSTRDFLASSQSAAKNKDKSKAVVKDLLKNKKLTCKLSGTNIVKIIRYLVAFDIVRCGSLLKGNSSCERKMNRVLRKIFKPAEKSYM